MSRDIRFLVYPGFVLLNLSGPLEAIAVARDLYSVDYRTSVVSLHGGMIRSSCGLDIATDVLRAERVDTLIVAGALGEPQGQWKGDLVSALKTVVQGVRRTACVCTGAFLLAEAGMLDGRKATTHWYYAPELQSRYPALAVDGDRIFTSDNGVWTSAGMSAGIDMVLNMIEEDAGKEVAQAVARMLVVYYRRPGGQYQFSSLLDFDPSSDRIRHALTFARENLSSKLSVERLAEAASLSVRQFTRAFTAATGIPPAKAIERLRVDAARPMVEDTRKSFEEIAPLVGFLNAERMAQSFIRTIGQSPVELRRARRNTGATGAE